MNAVTIFGGILMMIVMASMSSLSVEKDGLGNERVFRTIAKVHGLKADKTKMPKAKLRGLGPLGYVDDAYGIVKGFSSKGRVNDLLKDAKNDFQRDMIRQHRPCQKFLRNGNCAKGGYPQYALW